MPKRLTTEEWIEKAKCVHGDKYDYSEAVYENNRSKVRIICNVHGVFEQLCTNHIRGAGCKACGILSRARKRTSNYEEFLGKAIKLHGTKYDYSDVVYVSSRTKVSIGCNTCNSTFEQMPNSHLNGGGCPKCSGIYSPTNEEYLSKIRDIFGEKYYYDKVVYTSNKTKIVLGCRRHGYFKITPSHLQNGKGCAKCAGVYKPTTEEYKAALKTLCGDKYIYDRVEYVNSNTKVLIGCKVHGYFGNIPSNIRAGKGCPSCAVSGFDKTKPAILYYLRINNGEAYKIGITNRSVKERFSNKELAGIEVLWTHYHHVGDSAYVEEQKILKLFERYKYIGNPLLSSGNTEMFNTNVFSK